jgi:hypothetical protein
LTLCQPFPSRFFGKNPVPRHLEIFLFVKNFKDSDKKRRARTSVKQVPDLSRQVRDLLKFLPDLWRRAAAGLSLCF